jgi:perosamine synthetase
MAKRIGRTLPPAAAPLFFKDILSGVSGLFEGRDACKRFEKEVKEYCSVRYCFAVSSGKSALVLILQALNELFPERDEVLIPAFTCFSVPSAIVRAGLKVRLCDLAPRSLDFDFARLEEQLDNPRLLCVIPTHMFGLPADVERVRSLVDRRGIFVVEDAAQAMGGESGGKKMGTAGDVGMFSLGRGKVISTVEGGLILTDNDAIGQIIGNRLGFIAGYGVLDCLKLIFYAAALSILIHPRIYWLPKMFPFLKLGETHFNPSFPIRKMSPFQAGLAKGWEKKIAGLKQARSKNAEKISGRGIAVACAPGDKLSYLLRFPVLLESEDVKNKVIGKSEKMGLGISGVYPDSIDGIDQLCNLSEGVGFPRAKDIARRMVTLPLHPFVTEQDIDEIARLLAWP